MTEKRVEQNENTTYDVPREFWVEIAERTKYYKNGFSINRFLKYISPEFKKWLTENNIQSYFLTYAYKNQLLPSKIVIPTCQTCGKTLSSKQVTNGSMFCSRECASHSKEVIEKAKKTSFEKYGKISYTATEEYKKRASQTNLRKYGTEIAAQSEKVKEKYKVRHRSEYWDTFYSKLEEKKIVPMFTKEEYINNKGRRFKCSVCGKEFTSDGIHKDNRISEKNHRTVSSLNVLHIYCPHCGNARYSKVEKEVVEFIKSIYDGEIQENVRGLLTNSRMELDIFLPSWNLGIEFDGDYWHSLENVEKRDETKNQLCEEKGIRLIRVKEKDWDSNKEKVKRELRKIIESIKLLNSFNKL